jgi:aspartyl-tRNA(Asn)/glutamyl-tRNA(Gln) amidotransferase subunit B
MEMNNSYEPVIGIEVHAQLRTASKMFCACSTSFGDSPNTHTCPVCLALPGSLPMVNRKAVVLGLKAARALKCELRASAQFARKNYFYPDLPKGYQISMYQFPIGVNGKLELLNNHGELTQGIGIERVHLEEDTAKLSHQEGVGSLIDFNRSGVPLLEIVSKPDIAGAAEAVQYLKELRRLLRFLGISNANMEEGSFRCEVNISIRPEGEERLGTKVEIKNLNSFRAVERSIEYEIDRQALILRKKGEIRQATLGWDEREGKTVHQRYKEKAPEYRYFPEPDLPDLHLEGELLNDSLFDMESIPARRVRSLIERFGVSYLNADLLVSGTGAPEENPYYVADFFVETVQRHRAQGTPTVNLMTGTVFEYLNRVGMTLDQTGLTPKKLAEVTKMVDQGDLSSTSAKRVVSIMLEEGGDVRDVVLKEGLVQVSDEDELIRMVKEIIEENQDIAESIRRGKVQAIGALVGLAMKKSKGQANPKRVNELLSEMLTPRKRE